MEDGQLFIDSLEQEFLRNTNVDIAAQQKAYMKGKFEFYGMKSPVRREVQKPFLIKKYLPAKDNLEVLVKTLWNKPQREYHYFAQELAFKYSKQMEVNDIELFEYMIVNQSWWDTVDFIAPNLMGNYFLQFPAKKNHYLDKWLASDNIWLQRSCILFQLKYKEKMDLDILMLVIESLLGSKEFFINKAIGWILRERSKTDPNWVLMFVEKHELSNLSRREAVRLI